MTQAGNFGTETAATTGTTKKVSRIGYDKAYCCSLLGALRILLIITYFCLMVSAAAIPLIINGSLSLDQAFSPLRDAVLFFSVVGLIGSILKTLFVSCNCVHYRIFERLPWILIYAITAALWIIPLFVLGILCGIKEFQARKGEFQVNIGAFASCAFFCFLSAIILIIEALMHFCRLKKAGPKANFE